MSGSGSPRLWPGCSRLARIRPRISETYPLEIRALAIAVFYSLGTGLGGVAGPWLFGVLIDTGSRYSVLGGYLFGAVLMVGAGLIAWRFAVRAERRSLEDVSKPLGAV